METNLIKYIVYCTVCTENKYIYIGVHKTNIDFFDGYLGCDVYANRPSTYERSKTAFQYAVKTYGPKKFIRNTLAIFDNAEEAYALESILVNKEFLKRNDVYNMCLGGGAPSTQILPVYQYSNKGEYITKYASINEASKAIGCAFKTLWAAIQQKCKCSGFFWTLLNYDKLDLSLMHNYTGHKKIPIYQYDNKGVYECCYDSINAAAKVLEASVSNLYVSLKTGTKCRNKYFTNVYRDTFSLARNQLIARTTIHLYDLEGKYIASYNNAEEAKRKLKIKGHIYTAIKLKRVCGGYQWRYDKVDSISPIKQSIGRPRKVGKYDKDWNLIQLYDSIQKAKEENSSSIIHVLYGRNEFSKGFRYKFIDLVEDIV